MNRRRLIAVLLTAVLTTACSAPGHRPQPQPEQTGSADTAASVPPDDGDRDRDGDGDGDGDGVGTASNAPPAGAAVVAAVTYIQAWARPELARDQWQSGIRPLVTPAYGQLLADTDPANVPAHTVTGNPRPVSSTTDVVIVDVPTDAGPIQVTVITAAGRWLVATAAPAGAL